MRFIEKIHSMQYPNNKERLSVVYLYGTDFSETTWPNFSKLCTLPKNDIRRKKNKKKIADFLPFFKHIFVRGRFHRNLWQIWKNYVTFPFHKKVNFTKKAI